MLCPFIMALSGFAKAGLLAQGIEAMIVCERDYLNAGGTLYYVKWNND